VPTEPLQFANESGCRTPVSLLRQTPEIRGQRRAFENLKGEGTKRRTRGLTKKESHKCCQQPMATRAKTIATGPFNTLSFYLIGDPSILEPAIATGKTFDRLKGVCYLRRRKFSSSAFAGWLNHSIGGGFVGLQRFRGQQFGHTGLFCSRFVFGERSL
jgi:hypothetical protein